MSREPWWQPHDVHRQLINRRDEEELPAHEQRYASETALLFRGGDIDACS